MLHPPPKLNRISRIIYDVIQHCRAGVPQRMSKMSALRDVREIRRIALTKTSARGFAAMNAVHT